jgi:cephalosporin hydroxylase
MTDQQTIDDFHRLYYDKHHCFQKLSFLGVYTVKYPADLMVYAEILWECRPRYVIETGTHAGGSALFLATIMDAITVQDPSYAGEILTVDLYHVDGRKPHPRIRYLKGGSTDAGTAEFMRFTVTEFPCPVMAILDSDHSARHVTEEIELYAPLVTKGQYLIVEDSNIHGHPVCQEHGEGPYEAVNYFFATNPLSKSFQIDKSREKFLVTANPRGYLRRVS